MNQLSVQLSESQSTTEILDLLAECLPTLTPEVRKAASYILDNPNNIGISSVREIADAADVKPNTLVRMARVLGFEGYEDMRRPFREEIRHGRENFPDRARWLQSLAKGGRLDALYAETAEVSMRNIEGLYSTTNSAALNAAASDILGANTTYVLGVGISSGPARTFAYLAEMAVGTVRAIPHEGSLPVDGLVRASKGDILVAVTFKPYRREVVEAVQAAHGQGLSVIGISDSLASPILQGAKHRFVVPVNTPQFFTSTVALSALLETLMAFVVAGADPKVVASIERFHERRRALGIYCDEES